MSHPEWRHALLASPGHRLEAALFTTYEPADPAFLVEHLLPSLLQLSREPGDTGATRELYFGELAMELERLRGKLLIISSGARREEDGGEPLQRASPRYPWLWRYLMPFTVDGIQHAKLWLLHWSHDDGEVLDIIVSSTNLSESAFKGQLQAGWHCRVGLTPKRSDARLRTWGSLVPFIEALGQSAGTSAEERTTLFLALLARAECPEGVSFIPSIPSASGRQHSGAQLLGELLPDGVGPLHVHVCVPYVGTWTPRSFASWCKAVGASPQHLKLVWIDTEHPWAAGGFEDARWRLPRSSHASLVEAGVSLSRLGHRGEEFSAFHEEHFATDARWSHAKLYHLRRGRQRRLLVTSANFSCSAWGLSGRPPRNFELGVAFDSDWAIPNREFEPQHTPLLMDDPEPPSPSLLTWAQATWDGQFVTLEARTSREIREFTATLHLGPTHASLEMRLESMEATNKERREWRGVAGWSEPHPTPLRIQLTLPEFILDVPVIDVRTPEEFIRTPLPEVDPAVAEELRDALLVEAYGGPIVEPGTWTSVGGRAQGTYATGAGSSDYTVPAFAQARRWFKVIDNWQHYWDVQLEQGGAPERAKLRLDGTRIAAWFFRRAEQEALDQRVPARLAAEELTWRLKELSRED